MSISRTYNWYANDYCRVLTNILFAVGYKELRSVAILYAGIEGTIWKIKFKAEDIKMKINYNCVFLFSMS